MARSNDYWRKRLSMEDDETIKAIEEAVLERGSEIVEPEINDDLVHISELEYEIETEYKNWGKVKGLLTGLPALDNKLGGMGKGHVILIGGETCLHPDTPIFDPTNGTQLTVKQRYEKAEKFHVLALDGDKLVQVPADAPNKYYKTSMIELSCGDQKIVVTPKHKIWNGQQYVSADSLLESEQALLPTISDSDQQELFANALHYWETDEGCLADYHLSRRLCDQRLQQVSENDLSVSPLRVGVHEPSYSCSNTGVLGDEQVHSRLCLWSLAPSSADFSRLVRTNHVNVWNNRFARGISSLISQIRSFVYRFCSYSYQTYRDVYIRRFVPSTRLSNDYRGYSVDYNSYVKYKQWGVKRQTDEVYYDFNVPVLHNYYASGLIHHNSNGKSALAANIAVNVAKTHGVLFITLEMAKAEIGARIKHINGGTIDGLDIMFQTEHRLTYKDVKPLLKNAIERGSVELVLLDYLQYLGRGMTEKEVAIMSKEIKTLALEFNIPFLVIVSLRKSEGGRNKRKWTEIEIEDYMGTGSIGYDCDAAMIASRKNKSNEFDNDHLYVKMLKTRNAHLDYNDRYLEFDWSQTRITENWVTQAKHEVELTKQDGFVEAGTLNLKYKENA